MPPPGQAVSPAGTVRVATAVPSSFSRQWHSSRQQAAHAAAHTAARGDAAAHAAHDVAAHDDAPQFSKELILLVVS